MEKARRSVAKSCIEHGLSLRNGCRRKMDEEQKVSRLEIKGSNGQISQTENFGAIVSTKRTQKIY